MVSKSRKLKLAELVLDHTIYPRTQIDPQHVKHMREALCAGVVLRQAETIAVRHGSAR